MPRRPRNGRSLLVAVVLCTSALPYPPPAAACDRSCKIRVRSALCQYSKCVLQLDRKKRFDEKDRKKECLPGDDNRGGKRGGRTGRDDENEEGEYDDGDFVFGESDCLPSLTEDVADLFAETCAEGGLKVRDACEWGRMYVEESCRAERAKVSGNEEPPPFERSQCDKICPPEQCDNLITDNYNSCVNTFQRKKCEQLQQDGCQNINIMESCPYQYSCGDSRVGRGLIEEESEEWQ